MDELEWFGNELPPNPMGKPAAAAAAATAAAAADDDDDDDEAECLLFV